MALASNTIGVQRDSNPAATGWEPGALRPRLVRWTLVVLGAATIIVSTWHRPDDSHE